MTIGTEREEKRQTDRQTDRDRDKEREIYTFLFTRVIDKHVCFFYIQLLPKQGTTREREREKEGERQRGKEGEREGGKEGERERGKEGERECLKSTCRSVLPYVGYACFSVQLYHRITGYRPDSPQYQNC